MSGLRDKLRRLTKASHAAAPSTPNVEGSPRSLDEVSTTEAAEWMKLGAEIVKIEEGSFVRRTTRYDLTASHGRYVLGDLLRVGRYVAPLGKPEQAIKDASQLLFFDTETTGLGIGAGNVPFMIGYGYVEDGRYTVEQLLIRNPAEERFALAYFKNVLDRFSHLVTYNGRTFDWPVLANRYVIHRLQSPRIPAHIDLLYPSRSLWRPMLGSCRLGNVEERVLGYKRAGDLPGSEAPVRYVHYLQTGRIAVLEDVFVHNERDILSLTTLIICCHELLSSRAISSLHTEIDGIRLAVWLDKLGHREQAMHALEHTVRTADLERAQLLEAATLWKRWRLYDQAAALWLHYCKRYAGTLHAVEPLIELAKYYEHRISEPDQALACAIRARKLVERRISLNRSSPSDRALLSQIDRRLDRLRDKLGKPRQEMMLLP